MLACVAEALNILAKCFPIAYSAPPNLKTFDQKKSSEHRRSVGLLRGNKLGHWASRRFSCAPLTRGGRTIHTAIVDKLHRDSGAEASNPGSGQEEGTQIGDRTQFNLTTLQPQSPDTSHDKPRATHGPHTGKRNPASLTETKDYLVVDINLPDRQLRTARDTESMTKLTYAAVAV